MGRGGGWRRGCVPRRRTLSRRRCGAKPPTRRGRFSAPPLAPRARVGSNPGPWAGDRGAVQAAWGGRRGAGADLGSDTAARGAPWARRGPGGGDLGGKTAENQTQWRCQGTGEGVISRGAGPKTGRLPFRDLPPAWTPRALGATSPPGDRATCQNSVKGTEAWAAARARALAAPRSAASLGEPPTAAARALIILTAVGLCVCTLVTPSNTKQKKEVTQEGHFKYMAV